MKERETGERELGRGRCEKGVSGSQDRTEVEPETVHTQVQYINPTLVSLGFGVWRVSWDTSLEWEDLSGRGGSIWSRRPIWVEGLVLSGRTHLG